MEQAPNLEAVEVNTPTEDNCVQAENTEPKVEPATEKEDDPKTILTDEIEVGPRPGPTVSAEQLSERDYYQRLGVGANASSEEIREAFVGLSKQHHPDSQDYSGDPESQKYISEAYNELKISEKRASYDRKLAETDESSRISPHTAEREDEVVDTLVDEAVFRMSSGADEHDCRSIIRELSEQKAIDAAQLIKSERKLWDAMIHNMIQSGLFDPLEYRRRTRAWIRVYPGISGSEIDQDVNVRASMFHHASLAADDPTGLKKYINECERVGISNRLEILNNPKVANIIQTKIVSSMKYFGSLSNAEHMKKMYRNEWERVGIKVTI